MKKIAFGMACTIVALFVFAMMLTIYGRAVRQKEAQDMLSQAIDTTLSYVMREKNHTIEKNEEFVADFLQALLVQKNSDADLTVSILDADCEQGILSVEVTETFRHPNGNPGSVSTQRTVIFDRAKEQEKSMKTVSFYRSDDELYKSYQLPEGSMCTVPRPPQKEGRVFRGWRFMTGQTGKAGSILIGGSGTGRYVLAAQGVVYKVTEDTKLIALFE